MIDQIATLLHIHREAHVAGLTNITGAAHRALKELDSKVTPDTFMPPKAVETEAQEPSHGFEASDEAAGEHDQMEDESGHEDAGEEEGETE